MPNLNELKRDGLLWLCGNKFDEAGEDKFKRAEAIDTVANLVNTIPNVSIKEAYKQDVRATFKIKAKEFNAAFDKIEKENAKKHSNAFMQSNRSEEYEIPKEVLNSGGSFDMYEADILKFGIFIHSNVIYSLYDKGYFKPVSNFFIEIINHMIDQENPMRLVKIKNTSGKKYTFDTPFESFLTRNSFMKMVEAFGDFQFFGQDADYLRIKKKLMEEMGDGRKIDVLGWQNEGFWAMNDCIIYKGEVEEIDNNGMIDIDGETYYIPSGNSIYLNNREMFVNQKKVVLTKSLKPLDWILSKALKVHGENFVNAFLHGVSGAFSDFVHSKLNFFPIMFLYGDASTGKDNIVELVQSFFGFPQDALVLTGRDNTAKAKIRELAQFQNMPAHFSEYKPDPEIDDMMKKLWDRRGYKRANTNSKYGSETVPVRCPIFVTSNFYPNEDAVITRFQAIEFSKTAFTQEEVNEYDELKDVKNNGISSHLPEILKLRPDFVKRFLVLFREVITDLKNSPDTITMAPRMLQNAAVYGATCKIAENHLPIPFTYNDWLRITLSQLKAQEKKRNSGSVVQRFWEVFMELVRDKKDPFENEVHYSVNGDELAIRYSMIHSKYLVMHYQIFKEQGRNKMTLIDNLRKSDAYVTDKDSHRYGRARSNATVFSLSKLHIHGDLMDHIAMEDERRRRYAETPEVKEPKMSSSKNNDPDELPF